MLRSYNLLVIVMMGATKHCEATSEINSAEPNSVINTFSSDQIPISSLKTH